MGGNHWFDAQEIELRQRKLVDGLRGQGIDMGIVSSWESLYYYLGIITLQSRSRVVDPMPIIVDTRNNDVLTFFPTSQFELAVSLEHENVPAYVPYTGSHPWKEVSTEIKKLGAINGVVGLDFRTFTAYHFDLLKKHLPEAKFVDCSAVIDKQRMIKSTAEHEYFRRSCSSAAKVLDSAAHVFKVDKTELEVARDIIRIMVEDGAEAPAFHPQVGSGYRSGLLNIAASDKRIEKGDIVMIDFGASYRYYSSDVARPFVIGRSLTNEEERASYAAAEITKSALSVVKSDTPVSAIHRAALEKANELGYDKYLKHSSGHGIGIYFWEPPALLLSDDTVLREGMTLAVEQGVYMPKFGFRFEQNLIVRRNGYEGLFNNPMETLQI